MKLGTLLLRDAVISLAQLEAALRAQVLYGGKLGTNLVELGFLDVDTLGGYLGRVTGLPVATRERFEHAPRAAVRAFDRELAELYTAFPLGEATDAPEALALAVADGSDGAGLERLAAQIGRALVPHIAPELRILYYLEKHYDIARKARYVRQGTTRRAPHAMGSERRRAQPAGGIEMPPVVRFEPRQRKPARTVDVPARATAALRAPRLDCARVAALIDAAETRAQIGDALIEYAVGRFDAAVVFVMRDANALGWRVFTAGDTSSPGEIEALSLPLGGASALQAAHDSLAAYRGLPPTAGRPVEKRLWQALGVDEPHEMLVAPVLVKQRVVNLIYVHRQREPLLDRHVDELEQLVARAAHAYVGLIQKAKAGEPRT